MRLKTGGVGLTLIELLVAITLMGILFGVSLQIFQTGLKAWEVVSQGVAFYKNSSRVMEMLTKELRQASRIQTIGENRILFHERGQKIRYLVRGKEVIREVENKSGKWEQSPKRPIAVFKTPVIMNFDRFPSNLIEIRITGGDKGVSSAVLIRNAEGEG